MSTEPNPASYTARQAAERINRMAASEEDLLSNGRLAIEIQTAIDASTAALRREVEEKTQQVAELTRERDELHKEVVTLRVECTDLSLDWTGKQAALVAERDAALARAEAGETLISGMEKHWHEFGFIADGEFPTGQLRKAILDAIAEAEAIDAATGGTK